MRRGFDRLPISSKSAVVILLIAILMFLVLVSSFTVGENPDQPPYLSFSADRDGLKGLRTLLSRRLDSVEEWRQPWTQLPGGRDNTMIAIAVSGIGANEQQPILDWISQGNQLVWIDYNLPDQLNVPGMESFLVGEAAVDEATGDSRFEIVEVWSYSGQPAPSSSWSARVAATDYRLVESPEASVLLADGQGSLAARYSYGEGSILVMLTPEWLVNDAILEEQHFELVWPLLLDSTWERAVWFDEYHHGFHARRSFLEVYPVWLLVIAVQATILACLWLLRKGKRFGPLRTPREWVVRRGDETLLAVAEWYRRRGLHRDAVQQQERYLRQVIQEQWGIRAGAHSEELIRAAAIHGDEQLAGKLKQLLLKLSHLPTDNNYSKTAFIQDSNHIAEMIQAVEKKESRQRWNG